MSVDELDNKIIKYAEAATKRAKLFVWYLLGSMVISFISIFFAIYFCIPEHFLTTWLGFIFFGLVILMVYIVATTRSWHNKNGVFCQWCNKNLIQFGEDLETFHSGGYSKYSEIVCPHCNRVVAKR